MNAATDGTRCPKGHTSADADYCSECGVRIDGSTAGVGPETSAPAMQRCPDCGTPREREDISFCEVCGFNFVTEARGEIGIMPSSQQFTPIAEDPLPAEESVPALSGEPVAQPVQRQTWFVVVSVDPSLRSPDSPEAPSGEAAQRLELTGAMSLIGRADEARGVFPEIAIPADEAVSRRHALLQRDDNGRLLLRDIGSANGTQVNGQALEAMSDRELFAGDQITLGHWSRIAVESRQS